MRHPVMILCFFLVFFLSTAMSVYFAYAFYQDPSSFISTRSAAYDDPVKTDSQAKTDEGVMLVSAGGLFVTSATQANSLLRDPSKNSFYEFAWPNVVSWPSEEETSAPLAIVSPSSSQTPSPQHQETGLAFCPVPRPIPLRGTLGLATILGTVAMFEFWRRRRATGLPPAICTPRLIATMN